MVVAMAVALTGCVPQWRHCVLSPRVEGHVEINDLESIDENGLQKFRLYLSCPI